MSHKKILILPGDGIGPEVVKTGKLVLQRIAQIFNHKFEYISASSNNQSTLPGNGIEFRISLKYDINW